jgi:fumarate reductase iron-sulfur subunit
LEPVNLQVQRYRPEQELEPVFEEYEVPYRENWMVLDALNHVKDHLDGTLSYRWACRMGVCGSCGMMVNGEPVLTCATYVEDVLPDPVRIEPLRGFPGRSGPGGGHFGLHGEAGPGEAVAHPAGGAPLEEGEYLQTPEEVADYKQYSMCINCMLCYAACPIYELEPDFIGPAAIALAQRYNLDSRDQGQEERMDVLSQHDGVWACTFVGECSVVCPKGVDPAGAIQRYKLEATAEWFRSVLMPWRKP